MSCSRPRRIAPDLAGLPGARAHAAWHALLVLLTGMMLAGCASLLPTTRAEVVSEWQSYDDGQKAIAALAPYHATRTDVHKAGLDPRTHPGITVLHFGDVLQRFAAAALVSRDDVERGIRDCVHAGMQCSGYLIAVKKLSSRRVGNFWLDSLNFRRETLSQGWKVDALLVFVDDMLVYELVGGEPTINEREVRRNPLGPLQGWGDQTTRLTR